MESSGAVVLADSCLPHTGGSKGVKETELSQPSSPYPFIADETWRGVKKGRTLKISSCPSTGFGQTFCHKQIIWLKQHLFVNRLWASILLHSYIINVDIVCEQMLALGQKLFAWIICSFLLMACSCSPGSQSIVFPGRFSGWRAMNYVWLAVRHSFVHCSCAVVLRGGCQPWLPKAQGQQVVLHVASRWEQQFGNYPCVFFLSYIHSPAFFWLLSQTGSWAVGTCGLISYTCSCICMKSQTLVCVSFF